MFKSDIKKERILLALLLVVLFGLFFRLMGPFILTQVLSAILVVLFYPLFEKLKARLKKPRLSAFLITMLVFFMILLPATLTITLVVEQLYSILGSVNFSNLYHDLISAPFYQDSLKPWFESLTTNWPVLNNIDLFGLLADAGKQVAAQVSRFSPKLFFGTAGFLFDFFVMMVSVYFLLIEGPYVLGVFKSLLPLKNLHQERLLKEIKNTVHACVLGYLVTSLVQAILATSAFWISDIQGFAVLGTLLFFMSMVPVIGATGVWLPVTLGLFIKGYTALGVFNLIWGAVVVSGIDNILKPIIIQGKTRIHPLLVFFSLFGGILWFGPMGILFGPVITSVLLATIKMYKDEI